MGPWRMANGSLHGLHLSSWCARFVLTQGDLSSTPRKCPTPLRDLSCEVHDYSPMFTVYLAVLWFCLNWRFVFYLATFLRNLQGKLSNVKPPISFLVISSNCLWLEQMTIFIHHLSTLSWSWTDDLSPSADPSM